MEQTHAHPTHSVTMPNTHGFAHPVTNISEIGVTSGMLIAEFGSGSGHYTLAMLAALKGHGHVFAIDVQKDMLRKVQNEAQKKDLDKCLEIIWGDIEIKGGSKIAEKSLDMVLMSNVLFQLPDRKVAFVEAARILKPYARLVIIDWSESFNNMGPRKEDVVTAESAQYEAESVGFVLTRTFSAGAHHYGIIMSLGIPQTKIT